MTLLKCEVSKQKHTFFSLLDFFNFKALYLDKSFVLLQYIVNCILGNNTVHLIRKHLH